MEVLYQVSYGPFGAAILVGGPSTWSVGNVAPARYGEPMSPLTPGMTPSQVGERAETAVMAALAARGHRILIPFGSARYDIGYEDAGRLVRVQVKCGWIRDGALGFYTHKRDRGRVRDYRNDADYFGIYCHERAEVYMIPVRDVPTRVATLRLDPPKNGQSKKIRWAEPYRVGCDPIPALIEGPDLRLVGDDVDRQLSILTDIDMDASMPSMTELEMAPAACCVPLTEATISDAEADTAAELFKALADPNRVLILNRLLACGEAVCVCDLNAGLDLSQPTVSFHLKKLVSAGLIHREQRGTWAFFTVIPEAIDRLSGLFKVKESV
jgi:ArsR family transcriptional regulator, arsenate/arsenite/antimonite-responsive transcriptional repressor